VFESLASSLERIPSSVFMVSPPVFLTVTERFRVTTMRSWFELRKRSLTWALTSFSPAIYDPHRSSGRE
jgi:hypothetical protein